MKVVIDGVEYVPKAVIEHPAPEAVQTAVERLVTLYHLYGVSRMCRGARGAVFEALEALAPDMAKLVSNDMADVAYHALQDDDEP